MTTQSPASDAGPFRLDGQTAAVTGAASGIGLETARLLARCGARVVLLDRNGEGAREAASAIPDAAFRRLDVTDETEIDTVFGEIGPVDILVNCAGIALRRPAVEHSLADWNTVMAVNVTGSFLCARAVARGLIAQGRGGAIVNIASIMGLSGGGLYPNISYQTSKGAIVNMTRALAIEWAPNAIRVNAVAPTYVRTPFIQPLLDQPDLADRIMAMTPLGRLAEPEEVANAALYLASPGAAMVTGHTLLVDGGFMAQ